jgi:hypothetical protein
VPDAIGTGTKIANEPAGCYDEIVGRLGELAAQGVQRLVAPVQLEGRPSRKSS